jgi:hypothetical protein
LDNIWPNADLTAWRYDYVLRTWDSPGLTVYGDLDSVPPAPTMDEIEALLVDHPIGDNPESLEGIYSLTFDGDITTGPGVTAQNLSEVLVTEDGPGLVAGGVSGGSAALRRLASHLPDAYWHTGSIDTFETLPVYPLFVHGGAWEKTNEWIVTYGELSTLPRWKFLEADLEVGHEFTFELIPFGTDEAFLHCRILRQLSFETQTRVFEKAIECLYLLDTGILSVTDVGGEPIGWTRSVDYGVVVYAPTVGPVYSYRRMLVQPGDQPSTGAGDVTINLIER